MSWATIKCKLFHQSWWEPYRYGGLYDHPTMQCDKCGMIYDEVDTHGNTPYELKWDIEGLIVGVIIVALGLWAVL